jgi:hypothetical protein
MSGSAAPAVLTGPLPGMPDMSGLQYPQPGQSAPSLPAPGNLAAHSRAIDQINQQKMALVQQQAAQQRAQQQKIEALQQQEAARPDAADTPPPQIPQPDPVRGFASAASIFALIAAAFTHTPAAAAMDGLAASINARNKNDMDGYQKAYDQWKEQTDITLKRDAEHRAKVNQALELMQSDAAAGEAAFKTINTEYGDEKSDIYAQTRDWASVAQIGMERERLSLEMAKNAREIEAQKPLNDARIEYGAAQKANADQPNPDNADRLAKAKENLAFITNPTSAANQPGSKDWQFRTLFNDAKAHGMSDAEATVDANTKLASAKPTNAAQAKEKDADTLAADRFKGLNGRDPGSGDEAEMAKLRQASRLEANGVMSDAAALIDAQVALKTGHPPSTLGRSQANIAKFNDVYAKEAARQGLSANDIAANTAKFSGELSESRALGSTSARIDFGAQELDVALPQALELSQRVYRPGFKKAAEIQQALQGQSSDPDLLEFAQQNQAVMSAYAQVMSRGGVSSVSAMDRAEKLLSTATSQAGYLRQLDRLHKEVQTMLTGTAGAKQHLQDEITGGHTEVPPPVLTGVPRPGAASSLPPAARAQLSEGHETTFANGQVWTLRNGQPEQVK